MFPTHSPLKFPSGDLEKITYLDEDKIPGKLLGRHVVHDRRSRGFRAVDVLPPTPQPRVKAWYRNTLWDQNVPGPWNGYEPESSCTIQACGGCLVTAPFTTKLSREAKIKLNSPAFRYTAYRRAQQLDPWDGEEPDYYGSSGVAACKALIELGIAPPGWQYRWAFGGNEAMKVLPFFPLSVGTNWYSGFDHPDTNGRVHKTGFVRGGHQWEVIDYSEPDDLVIGLNSWGRGFGRNGRFAMSRPDFYNLLEEDGDVVVWTPPVAA